MERKPLVTIAIPTYNRADYLRMAVESALGQSYSSIEVLVSDNASTDETEGMMRAWRAPGLRYVRQPRNLGMVGNWNSCVQHARGDYFLLLSDDDLLAPDAIERLLAQLRQPGVAIAYSPVHYVSADLKTLPSSTPGPAVETGQQFIAASLRGERLVMPSATMHLTDAVRALGGYPPVGTVSDLALRLALATHGGVRCVAQPLVRYRVHETNLSRGIVHVTNSFVALICWASQSASPLYLYRTAIRQYAARFLYLFALRRMARGEHPQMQEARQAARRFQYSWGSETLIYTLSLPPVRVLAQLRRKLLGLEDLQ
jgi:glycosyltransferase involved in cell wall biosynthesis